MEPAGVGVEAGRCIRVDVADMIGIVPVGGPEGPVVLDRLVLDLPAVKAAEHLLRRPAQPDPEVVDETELPVGIDLREQRQLGEGRSSANQRATGVVADPAQDRSPQTR
jgi:hypothetical protein